MTAPAGFEPALRFSEFDEQRHQLRVLRVGQARQVGAREPASWICDWIAEDSATGACLREGAESGSSDQSGGKNDAFHVVIL